MSLCHFILKRQGTYITVIDVLLFFSANEDEKSSIVRKNKVCRTQKSDKTAKRKRKITPEKTKLEAPLQKKKKKRNSSA